MRVAVVGATGLLGRHLVAALVRRGDEVVALSRGAKAVPGARVVRWDPAEGPFPDAAREGVEAIVNLAGSPIGARRWTARRRREMRESRVLSSRGAAAALGDGGPTVLVNAGGTNYYGVGEATADESAPPGDDFMARTCVLWDQAAAEGEGPGTRTRVVRLRIGFVLMREGGGLPTVALPFRLGVGGPLGGGRQWVPWIHVADVVGLILLALDRPELSGPLNVTAPEPVRQRELARALGRELRRPALLPTPGFPIRLVLGEAATLALDGTRAVPTAALAAGYRFRFTDVEAAMRDVLA